MKTEPLEVRVLREALRNLLSNRDFMGLQLDLAYDNINEIAFRAKAKKFLEDPSPANEMMLRKKIDVILNFFPTLDAESLSVLFDCPIGQVEKMLLDKS